MHCSRGELNNIDKGVRGEIGLGGIGGAGENEGDVAETVLTKGGRKEDGGGMAGYWCCGIASIGIEQSWLDILPYMYGFSGRYG